MKAGCRWDTIQCCDSESGNAEQSCETSADCEGLGSIHHSCIDGTCGGPEARCDASGGGTGTPENKIEGGPGLCLHYKCKEWDCFMWCACFDGTCASFSSNYTCTYVPYGRSYVYFRFHHDSILPPPYARTLFFSCRVQGFNLHQSRLRRRRGSVRLPGLVASRRRVPGVRSKILMRLVFPTLADQREREPHVKRL